MQVYKNRNFSQQNAVIICCLADQQLTRIEEEAPFPEFFTFVMSWKQRLQQFLGQLQAIANDPPFAVMFVSVFTKEYNLDFYEVQKQQLTIFADAGFCASHGLKQSRYSVQLDQNTFETPIGMRLLYLNFYGRQVEFFAKQISVQMHFYLKSSLGFLLFKVKDAQERLIMQDFENVGTFMADAVVKLSVTVTARTKVRLQQLLAASREIKTQNPFSELMWRFVQLDHLAVLYVLSMLDVSLQDEYWQVYYFASLL